MVDVIDPSDIFSDIESENDDENDKTYATPKSPIDARKKKCDSLMDKKKRVAAEVKKFPCLWDKKDKFHRNQVKRSNAWIKIAAEINATGISTRRSECVKMNVK